MGRRRNSMRMPTSEMRVRAWARAVRQELFPTESADSSLSHRINGELIERAKKPIKKLSKKDGDELNELVRPESGAEFVSSGRWSPWWAGKEQPTMDKIDAIERILPGTKRWFEPGASQWHEHPAHSLLYALDLWGTTESRRERAMLLLMSIADTWRPRSKRATPSGAGRNGWYVAPFINHMICPDLVYKHYCSLEPASIVISMIWTGNDFKIHQTEIFQRWLMDLIAAALAIDAILIEEGPHEDAISLGRDSGFVSASIVWIFIANASHFARANEEAQARRAVAAMIEQNRDHLPTDADFHKLVWEAIGRFEHELRLLGCEPNSLSKFDSRVAWARKLAII